MNKIYILTVLTIIFFASCKKQVKEKSVIEAPKIEKAYSLMLKLNLEEMKFLMHK